MAVWPQRGDPALEAASEQERVDAVDEGAQPALAGDAVVEGREAAQNGEVVRAPGNDVVEVVAGGDGRAGDQEQHLMEGVEHAPRLAGIVEGGELFQEQAQAVARQVRAGTDLADVGRKGVGVAGAGGHGRAPCRIRSRHGNTPSVSPQETALCVASRAHPRTVCPGRIDRPAILIEGATAKVSSVIHHRSPGASQRQGISFLASGLYGETVAHLLQPMPKLRA